MHLEGIPSILDFDPYATRIQPEPTHTLGELVAMSDQRSFRYFSAGASNTLGGKIKISPAKFTTWDNMTTAAASIGDTQVTVTLGATNNLAANALAEGYVIISDGTGKGTAYKVKSNPAIVASATGTITLFDPLVAALDTTTKTSLVLNAFNGSIEGTTQTSRSAGVPLIAVLAADFGWTQTKGIASCLYDGAVALGNTVVTSSSVAGAVAIGSTTYATFQATTPVGKAVTAGVDTKYNALFLTID